MELKTYRVMGHYVGDPAVYRSKEEAKDWRANRDPIELFRAKLLALGAADAARLDKVRAEVAAEIADAVEFSRNAPKPGLACAREDVYADMTV